MAAPKGNKYAEGNEGGRPRIHDDPKEVQRLIDEYFVWILGEYHEEPLMLTQTNKDGEEYELDTGRTKIVWDRRPEPPTVTGLSLHLGFADKSTLYDYKEYKEFSHSIKRAVTRIEKYHELAVAQRDKCTGNIFALKNFGWKDRSEIDHNVKTEQPLFGE